jgi:Fe-S-cluster-containing dehydrogenase component
MAISSKSRAAAEVVVRAQVVKTIRPDTVFVPYHWPLDRSANNCTIRAIDPVSNIPEFKICAVRLSKTTSRRMPLRMLGDRGRRHSMSEMASSSTTPAASAASPACMPAPSATRTAAFQHDSPGDHQRRDSVQTAPQVCMHCEDPICARVCPADAIKKTPDGVVQSSLKPRCIGCSNCVLSCPFGVPKYHERDRPDDEVRHVLRPQQRGQEADVRHGLSLQALTFATAEEIQRTRRGVAINSWKFGKEEVTTKVFVIVPREVERVNVELDPYDVALMLENVG